MRTPALTLLIRFVVFAAIALAAGGTIGAGVTQGADFSGTWIAEVPAVPPPVPGKPAPPLRGDMGSGWGTPLTLTQSASELVVAHALFSRYDLQPPLRFVYRLDGTESRNTTMAGHLTQTRVSRAAWDGQALKIVTSYPGVDPGTGKPFTSVVTHRVSLESPTQLVIEAVRGAVLGGRETSSRTVYRRGS
jgi:hypothetical protein